MIKKFNLLVGLFLMVQAAYAQTTPEFSFVLYMEDAAGNRDSLVLGYDAAATDTADATFGDVDIANVPLDSVIDLRFTGRWSPMDYQSKKAILKYTCNGSIPAEEMGNYGFLLIRSDRFPVTFSWNMQDFQGAANECHRGSVIVSSDIAAQYLNLNVVSQFNSILSRDSSYIVDYDPFTYCDFATTILNNGQVDTVYMMPFWFIDTAIQVGIAEQQAAAALAAWPNPVGDYTEIMLPTALDGGAQVLVFDARGQQMALPYSVSGERISLTTSDLSTGMYFCRIYAERRQYQVKFVKE